MEKKDAIIIAGGKGSRLQRDLPKALININGKPILGYQLEYLLRSELIKNIVLALGYKADKVMEYVESNYESFPIHFSVESEPLGTGGALKKALHKTTTSHVLVLNCDDITDIDISKLIKFGDNTICVAHPRLPFGRVIEKDGYAIFEEKPMMKDWVNCGWYLFNRDLLNQLPDKGSLEYNVLPNLKLKVYKHEGVWKTVNTEKDIIEFEAAELPDVLKNCSLPKNKHSK